MQQAHICIDFTNFINFINFIIHIIILDLVSIVGAIYNRDTNDETRNRAGIKLILSLKIVVNPTFD